MEQVVDYEGELDLPDEGEALRDPSTQKAVGRVARTGADLWANRPRPAEQDPNEPVKGAAINASLAL